MVNRPPYAVVHNPLFQMEVMRARLDASEALCEFCKMWVVYPMETLAYHLRLARMNLVTLGLADPVEAEIWLATIAHVAQVPVKALRSQVETECEYWSNSVRDTSDKSELLNKMLEAIG